MRTGGEADADFLRRPTLRAQDAETECILALGEAFA